MQNWWIAALQTAGIWTKEQAELVAHEVRNYIHKENLAESVEDLTAMLEHKKLNHQSVITNLQDEIIELKGQIIELQRNIDDLRNIKYTKLASKKKA